MGFNSNMANREVCDLIFLDYATKKPFLNLDYANTNSTEITGESVFAFGGKGHPKKIQFSGERGGTLTIETQIQSMKLWQLITGGDISKSAKFIKRVEKTVGVAGTITLGADETPLAGTVNIFLASDDCGELQECTVAEKVITLKTKPDGETKMIIYFMVELTDKVERISIKSTSFPKNFIVYGDTVMKTEEDEVLPYRLIAYKCAPQSNMSLSYSNSGDPGSITITCDLMEDQDHNILDLILEDVAE